MNAYRTTAPTKIDPAAIMLGKTPPKDRGHAGKGKQQTSGRWSSQMNRGSCRLKEGNGLGNALFPDDLGYRSDPRWFKKSSPDPLGHHKHNEHRR